MKKWALIMALVLSSGLHAGVRLTDDQVANSYKRCLTSKVLNNISEYIANIYAARVHCFSSSRPQFSECSLAINGMALRQNPYMYEIPYTGVLSLGQGAFKLENDQRKMKLKYPLPILLFKEYVNDESDQELEISEVQFASTSDDNYFINSKTQQKIGQVFSNELFSKCLNKELGL